MIYCPDCRKPVPLEVIKEDALGIGELAKESYYYKCPVCKGEFDSESLGEE